MTAHQKIPSTATISKPDQRRAAKGKETAAVAEDRAAAAKRKKGSAAAATAESMAAKQRDISVSEFFAKNRHLLGFDNPRKALLTAVKEAVDNSLDACEEAHIMPDLVITIKQLNENKFTLTVRDNGPGIVKAADTEYISRGCCTAANFTASK